MKTNKSKLTDADVQYLKDLRVLAFARRICEEEPELAEQLGLVEILTGTV